MEVIPVWSHLGGLLNTCDLTQPSSVDFLNLLTMPPYRGTVIDVEKLQEKLDKSEKVSRITI